MSAFALYLVSSARVAADSSFSKYVDAEGGIALPKDFRSNFVHLGSWLVQQKGAPGEGFHDVYSEAASACAFNKTGKWSDVATLVKEIRT